MSGYASLFWYELPETRAIVERLWGKLAAHLRAAGIEGAPGALARPDDPHEALSRDDLVLTQICGYVVGGVGRDRLEPLVTLRYPGTACEGTGYRALFAARAGSGIERFEDLAGARAVINDPLSHTGCNALRSRVAAISRDRFFGSIGRSGSHAASVDWVREGRADVAAIDCITWALIERYRPEALDGLVVLERSPLAPSPPLVTAAGNRHRAPALREAIAAFFADPDTAAERDAVFWGGYEILDRRVYDELIPDQTHVAGFELDDED